MSEFKFKCPHCNQKFECDDSLNNCKTVCPGCNNEIILQAHATLKRDLPLNGLQHNMQFCTDCGAPYSRRAMQCPKCGCPSQLAKTHTSNISLTFANLGERKSRLIYILLGIFFGTIGIHNFYSGNAGRGIAKIILTCLIYTYFIALIWALIEVCTVNKDAKGVPFV